MDAFDEKAYAVLFVDDEVSNLTAVDYALGDRLTIDLAASAEEALRKLQERDYAVVLADHRMPRMTGVELCEIVAQLRPLTVRMILTAYAEHRAVIDAIERGRVHRYLLKPFRNEELHLALSLGIRTYHGEKVVRDLQRQLVESSQAHASWALRAEVAHEIASLVQPLLIRLASAARCAEGADAAKLRRSIDAARHDAERIRETVQRWTKKPPGEESCEVAAVTASVASLFERLLPRGIVLRVGIEDAPRAGIAGAALAQVLLNLLLNAKQSLDGRGTPGVIELSATSLGGETLVRVRDDGSGIAPEALPHIYTPGFTTRVGRPGHGLTIARRLVEEAGGRIEIVPLTAGIEARVTLPRIHER